ncbi:beta strand repeat-containing protein [Urbifossiella limnaea]|uniref:FG-GAP repeat protein n=1 Tax=Urbifossiella limnaea TaxID=2528023 RepID=A0A517XUW3_9BACT|nr:autotransporter-associated beta strand repeat-containing protein [Urbifossiella limnaea]QDU21287.1 FG-GAP repeat protein [Urbifossiella limnaea]
MVTKTWLRLWKRACRLGGPRPPVRRAAPLGRLEAFEDRVVPANYVQNFGDLAAPALPTGWTNVNNAGANPWAGNGSAATVAAPAVVTDTFLQSPVFNISAAAGVQFDNNYLTENSFDGGVLEVSVNGGAFVDILAAGGSFIIGGYSGTLGGSNPIAGRQAWTGNSGGTLTTAANLPAVAVGGTVQLRWRMATDGSVPLNGWTIDGVIVANASTQLVYAAPPASTVSSYTLRVSGSQYQIVDTANPATVLASQSADATSSISFSGRAGATDTFVLDTSGGDITAPVAFLGLGGTGGGDSLQKIGAGRAVLGGTSSYAGTTTVTAGTLQVGAGGSTGNLGAGAVVNNGTLSFGRSNDVVIGNAISGSGTLVQIPSLGGRTLFLTGTNTYTGPTVVQAGNLVVGTIGGTTGTLGTGPVTVLPGTRLNFGRSDATTVANPIDGGGSVSVLGGDVTFTGANTYTGITSVDNNSVLRVGAGGTTGTLGTGPVTTNGFGSSTLVFNRSDNITVPNNLNNTLAVTQAGTGTITFPPTANLAYGGVTAVTDGTLLLNGTLPLGLAGSGVTLTGTGALGGSGSTPRAVAVAAGGAVLPGDPTTIATLSTGSVAFNGGGTTFGVKLGGPGAVDVLAVTGTVALGGATLFVLPVGAPLPIGSSVVILQNDGADAVGGTFAGVAEGGVALDAGGAAYRVSYVGGDGNDVTLTAIPTPGALVGPLLVTGPGTGSGQVFGPTGGGQFGAGSGVTLVPGFAGELHGALGDVTGDGVPDGVVGTGPGGGRVVVVDGANGPAPNVGNVLADFVPFPGYAGGLFVAVGDLTGDGIADVVVTPDAADAFSGPVPNQLPVRVYNGASLRGGTSTPSLVAAFDGLASLSGASGQNNPLVKLGGRPAVADVNGDGLNDLLVAAGTGGGPRVTVWNGTGFAGAAGGQPTTNPIANLFVFESTQRGGAFVTAGDVTGDGQAEIAVGGGPGGGPRLRVVNSAVLLGLPNLEGVNLDDPVNLGNGLVLNNFFAGSSNNRGGVRVAAKDVDGDGLADIVTGSGSGEASAVRVYRATQLATAFGSSSEPGGVQTFDPFAAVIPGGVWVG